MNTSNKGIQCPLCSKSFPAETIEAHAGACTGAEIENDSRKRRENTPLHPLFSPKRTRHEEGNSDGRSDDKSLTLLTSPSTSQHGKLRDNGNSQPEATQTLSSSTAPLAERVRPSTLEEFIGQDHVMRLNSLIRNILEAKEIPSMIIWGPPGCGKTTLARIAGKSGKQTRNTMFVPLSATNSNTEELKSVIQRAKNGQAMMKKKTIVFLDEIHHFNKKQQDILLPAIENGTITLIGATTENPSFSLNSALLSRCQVIPLQKLGVDSIETILVRALESIGVGVIKDGKNKYSAGERINMEEKAVSFLANMCDGDARTALNKLELAVQSARATYEENGSTRHVITVEHIKDALQRSHVLYDRTGDEHYQCISALIKSVRGSDANAALYWMTRMLQGGEDPLFIARRMIAFASEDIGIADTQALVQATSTYQSCQFLGKPVCEVVLAQCVIYMCRAPKSKVVESAWLRAKNHVMNHVGPLPAVPLHLRNASTRLMKDLGYGKGYVHDSRVKQQFLPPELKDLDFFK